MYKIKTEHSFDSAHFLANYKGKCSNIHGHRWRVIFEICATKLNYEGQLDGMITDFSYFKKDVKTLIDEYDHALIIQKGTLREKTLSCLLEDDFNIIELDFRPTAENFSKHFFYKIKEKGYCIEKVVVYETPNNSATYEEIIN